MFNAFNPLPTSSEPSVPTTFKYSSTSYGVDAGMCQLTSREAKTPEESLEESFTIQESFYTRTEQYNFKEPPFKYSEEDNSVDETDLESTTQSLRKRKHDSLDFENHFENHIEKVIVEVSKRVAENDNTIIYVWNADNKTNKKVMLKDLMNKEEIEKLDSLTPTESSKKLSSVLAI